MLGGLRIVAFIAPMVLLAACEPSPQPDPLEPPAPPASAAMGPGLYAIGDDTTVYIRTRLAADGTYANLGDGSEPVGGGRWRNADDKICFDPEGEDEDQQESCWRNSPAAANGSFTSTGTDGSRSYKVTPLAE